MLMTMHWPIDWETPPDTEIVPEVDFWREWLNTNQFHEQQYERAFLTTLWDRPRSAWTDWQQSAEQANLLLLGHDNWLARLPYTLCERAHYRAWLYERNAMNSDCVIWRGPEMVIDRHAFYNLDLGYELKAVLANHPASLDIRNTQAVQALLDQQSKLPMNEPLGRRSLAERYRSLTQQMEQATELSRRQIFHYDIDRPRLLESDAERRQRIDYTYQVRQRLGDLREPQAV